MRTINGIRADDLLGDKLTARQRIVIPIWMSAIGAGIRGLGRRVLWLARRWSLTVPLAAAGVGWQRWGWLPVLAATLALAAILVGWRLVSPASFRRLLGPAIGNYRLTVRYWRRWRAAMIGTGLAVQHEGGEFLPVIKSARCTGYTDTLHLRLLHGQTPEDFAAAAEGLRHVYGAYRCTARETRPGRVAVKFYARDPLVAVVPALPVPRCCDLTALPLGFSEDAAEYRLRLLGTHLLVAGASGSGKGSVLWSLIRSLGEHIRSGAVQLWVIDRRAGWR